MEPKFISIEGNIGSGKSTILRIIRENFPELVILDEPLASWEKIGEKQNINLLELYYQNSKRWGFTFQIYAFMTRLRKWTQFTRLPSDSIKVSERSLLSDRYVFASIMSDMEILCPAEHEIYLQCFRNLTQMNRIAKVKGVIYVQCDPQICSVRIKQRAREGEGLIPLDYLKRLHMKHEEWLNPSMSPIEDEMNELKLQDGYMKLQGSMKLQGEKLKQNPQILDKSSTLILEQSSTPEQSRNLADQKTDPETNPETNPKTNPETNPKVLILNNTLPIDKNRMINEIKRWLETVF